jgi:hypothetical protein
MTITKWALLGIVIAISVWFGITVGIADYRASCEPMGNADGQRWLECTE